MAFTTSTSERCTGAQKFEPELDIYTLKGYINKSLKIALSADICLLGKAAFILRRALFESQEFGKFRFWAVCPSLSVIINK